MAYWDAQEFLSEEGYPEYSHERSRFVPESLSPAAIATILDELRAWPGTSVAATWKFFLMGGAIDRLSPAETAFVHRGNAMISSIELEWNGIRIRLRGSKVNQLLAVALPRPHGTLYLVVLLPELHRSRAAAITCTPTTARTWARLREIKRRYDPKNVFRYPQSIPV